MTPAVHSARMNAQRPRIARRNLSTWASYIRANSALPPGHSHTNTVQRELTTRYGLIDQPSRFCMGRSVEHWRNRSDRTSAVLRPPKCGHQRSSSSAICKCPFFQRLGRPGVVPRSAQGTVPRRFGRSTGFPCSDPPVKVANQVGPLRARRPIPLASVSTPQSFALRIGRG